MPFLAPQSDTCKCSGGLPVQVTTGARRMGISKNFRAARGLQPSQQSARIVRRPGLGDLSTLPQDFANSDWGAVLSDSIPLIAGAGALWLTWHFVVKGHAKPKPRPRRRRTSKAEASQSWF